MAEKFLTNKISKKELEEKEALAKQALSKLTREEKLALRDLKIITAISIGKTRNKEIAKLLDTDKSYTSKRIKALEEQGLVFKEGDGKNTRYQVNQPRVLRFLTKKVSIKYRSIPVSEANKEVENG